MQAPAPVDALACTMPEFLADATDADGDERKALVEILANQEVHLPKKLAVLSVSQLRLPGDMPGGHIATLTEAMQRAAEIKAEQSRPAPEGAVVVPRTPIVGREDGQWVGNDDKLGQLLQLLTEHQLARDVTAAQSTQVSAAFDQTAFCESMKEAFNKPRSWEVFDFESKLATTRVSFQDLFPIEHQPPIYAVRKLVTKMRLANKEAGYTPFVYADLREYLPNFAPDFVQVEARRDVSKDDHAEKQPSKFMNFANWLLAWRRYSVAAHVTEQLEFAVSVAHEAVVAEVVVLGQVEGYGATLGPIYSDCER